MATLAGIGPGQEDARRVHTNLVLSLRAPDRECLSVVANFLRHFILESPLHTLGYFDQMKALQKLVQYHC